MARPSIPAISRMPIRVLVVEDHAPFRQFLTFELQHQPGLQIVGEAADGLEAVKKTQELRPDLILLDIGLPSLNGIEAARRIRMLSPESKIIFITQETSRAILEEALSLGAMAYLIKAHAGSELITAVETVLQGASFISNTMQAQDSVASQDPALFSFPQATNQRPCDHEVQFYSEEKTFLLSLSRFIEGGLQGGNVVIVVVTASHRERLLQIFTDQSVDIAAAIEQGRFVLLDAVATLSTFMQDGVPDRQRFFSTAGKFIREAEMVNALMHKKLLLFGEMVAVLCERDQVEAAIELERLWNELGQMYSFYLFCGYPLSDVPDDRLHARICAEHSAVRSAAV